MSNLLVVTLLRLDNGNWSWSTGDKNRTMEPRQGVGAQTAEQALARALDAAGYSSVEEPHKGEA